tara:strand:- start:899 stop:1666 length:768 start_codon:yes stop_codon:yes gene_type:complete
MKKDVAHMLADSMYSDKQFLMDFDAVVQYFVNLDKRLKKRVCELNNISITEWDEAGTNSESSVCQQQEEWTMNVMKKMFNIAPDYIPALKGAIEEYYRLVEDMDTKKQNVCTSFIMGLQNYTNVIAHHMAMMENTWTVTGIHIDMAKEILYDLYKNLIHWLEDKVKVGQTAAESRKDEKAWREAFKRCEVHDLEGKGRGWVKKRALFDIFGQVQNLSSQTTINERFNRIGHLFDTTRKPKSNQRYVRLKDSAKEE